MMGKSDAILGQFIVRHGGASSASACALKAREVGCVLLFRKRAAHTYCGVLVLPTRGADMVKGPS